MLWTPEGSLQVRRCVELNYVLYSAHFVNPLFINYQLCNYCMTRVHTEVLAFNSSLAFILAEVYPGVQILP